MSYYRPLGTGMVAAIIRPNHYDAYSTCLDLSGPSRLFFIFFTSIPQQLPILEHAVASGASAASYKSPSHIDGSMRVNPCSTTDLVAGRRGEFIRGASV